MAKVIQLVSGRAKIQIQGSLIVTCVIYKEKNAEETTEH